VLSATLAAFREYACELHKWQQNQDLTLCAESSPRFDIVLTAALRFVNIGTAAAGVAAAEETPIKSSSTDVSYNDTVVHAMRGATYTFTLCRAHFNTSTTSRVCTVSVV
jgi:hypothetical protein